MSESISGTVSQPALPPVSFSLDVYGSAARRIERGTTAHAKDEAQAHRNKVREARIAVELEAIEWAAILQRKLVERALDPKTDPKLATEISFKLIDRGVGKVREVESESAEAKRRGSGAMEALEVLAALSREALAGEAQARGVRDVTPSIEHDGGPIDTDQQAEAFLRGLHDGTLIEGSDDD